MATVTLPHAKVLAGVPFDIIVNVMNVSDRPATIGLIANLVRPLTRGCSEGLH